MPRPSGQMFRVPERYEGSWTAEKRSREYGPSDRNSATSNLSEETQKAVNSQFWLVVSDYPVANGKVLEELKEAVNSTKFPTELSKNESDPAIDSLFRSNHPPSPTQTASLISKLEECNANLLNLDYQILRQLLDINAMIEKVKSLQETRDKQEVERNHCRSWLGAFRLLPLEVIAKIFRYSRATPDDAPSLVPFPLQLSHVCSSWRNAALAYPTLWNELNLDLHSPTTSVEDQGTPSTRFANLMTLWYGRSNPALPLILSLRLNGPFSPASAAGFVEGACAVSSRITDIRLEIPDDCEAYPSLAHMAPFLSLPSGTFPALEKLAFIDEFNLYGDGGIELTVFNGSPRLRHVTIDCCQRLFRDNLPWHQLTYLKICGEVQLDTFTHIIFQCLQLEEAVVHSLTSENARALSLPGSRITFPHLIKLAIKLDEGLIFDYNDVVSILTLMDVPALQALSVARESSIFNDLGVPLFPLNSLILSSSNSYPSLSQLCLVFAEINVSELMTLLHMCPLMEDMTLCLDTITPLTLLNALTPGNKNAPNLFYLSTFTMAFDASNLVIGDGDFRALMVAFAELISTWNSQPKRRRPLSRFAIYPYIGYPPSTRGVQIEQDIRHHINENVHTTIVVDAVDLSDWISGLF